MSLLGWLLLTHALPIASMELDQRPTDTLIKERDSLLPLGAGSSRLPRAAPLSDTHMECMESGFCSLGQVKPWQGAAVKPEFLTPWL